MYKNYLQKEYSFPGNRTGITPAVINRP